MKPFQQGDGLTTQVRRSGEGAPHEETVFSGAEGQGRL